MVSGALTREVAVTKAAHPVRSVCDAALVHVLLGFGPVEIGPLALVVVVPVEVLVLALGGRVGTGVLGGNVLIVQFRVVLIGLDNVTAVISDAGGPELAKGALKLSPHPFVAVILLGGCVSNNIAERVQMLVVIRAAVPHDAISVQRH